MIPTTNSTPSRPGYLLIVDDEEKNRTLLRDPLEARGYEIEEAENGAEALLKVAMRPPDVILLDVMMPKIDGFDVCRRLKRDEKTASIPILMVTALSERKERLMGIEAGANDFLNKPVDLQDMALRVANAVYAKRLFDQLRAEQEKTNLLLLNILPPPIAERMKAGEVTIADCHPDVTVLFADLVGFSALTTVIAPDQVVYFLNEIFSAFDQLVEKKSLEKIKTIGDAYMVAGGIHIPHLEHAEAVAELALEMREEIERFNSQYNTSIRLRIGISTGPIVAGVIGRKKLAYDLWGDTVNVATRLGSHGESGNISVAESTYERLKSKYRFQRKDGINIGTHSKVSAYELQAR